MRNNKFEIKIESNVPRAKSELKSKLRKIFEMWGIFLTKEWVMRIKKEKLIDWLNNHPEVIRELRRRSGLD